MSENRTKIRDAIAESLGGAYDCLRVWSAWGVGTMGPDDFTLVADSDERLDEITDAAMLAMGDAAPAVEPSAENQPLIDLLRETRAWFDTRGTLAARLDAMIEALEGNGGEAAAIHYPQCWDTTAYPTAQAALSEVYAAFKCTQCVVHGWRCFHCSEAFTDTESAALHFGKSERQNPICTVDAAEYRAMEQRMIRYNEEDSDMHRQIYGMQAKHATELRREEEKGYARGLADGQAVAAGDMTA
ncbi:hypothetical protein PQR05_29855 [Paraburkholderia sediminicola]|uniref:hypothetical protein n=1 Tax=Paraburkholderia sediminicola TaxID=458836 RepID=UPI0038B6E163